MQMHSKVVAAFAIFSRVLGGPLITYEGNAKPRGNFGSTCEIDANIVYPLITNESLSHLPEITVYMTNISIHNESNLIYHSSVSAIGCPEHNITLCANETGLATDITFVPEISDLKFVACRAIYGNESFEDGSAWSNFWTRVQGEAETSCSTLFEC